MTFRAVDPLAVPVIEPAFVAALMLGGRVPPVVPLRRRAAGRPTGGLPPVAGPTAKHRPAPRPAAPQRAPPPRLWPSSRHAAPAAPCEEATWRDGGDRPTARIPSGYR